AHHPTEKGFEAPQSKLRTIFHVTGISNRWRTFHFGDQTSSNMPPATMSHEPSNHAFFSASLRAEAASFCLYSGSASSSALFSSTWLWMLTRLGSGRPSSSTRSRRTFIFILLGLNRNFTQL